jgi:hypothetical protein
VRRHSSDGRAQRPPRNQDRRGLPIGGQGEPAQSSIEEPIVPSQAVEHLAVGEGDLRGKAALALGIMREAHARHFHSAIPRRRLGRAGREAEPYPAVAIGRKAQEQSAGNMPLDVIIGVRDQLDGNVPTAGSGRRP